MSHNRLCSIPQYWLRANIEPKSNLAERYPAIRHVQQVYSLSQKPLECISIHPKGPTSRDCENVLRGMGAVQVLGNDGLEYGSSSSC
eukprot:3610543-Amphidinium_carterae.1